LNKIKKQRARNIYTGWFTDKAREEVPGARESPVCTEANDRC